MSDEKLSRDTAEDDAIQRVVSPASPMAERGVDHSAGPPPSFKISHLFQAPHLNPLNLKSQTLPLLHFASPACRNFHFAWLGFFVAFLSWFAFPPLFPEAIKADLKLTNAEVANSNIIALLATLVMRLVTGPLVDRFGPRKVMAGILVLGAIPSGLAGTASSAGGIYAIRFFIGILGSTFVPCVAWTSSFYDKNVVGTANALSAGWGNMGGGATYAIMVSLYNDLNKRLGRHKAWRVAFAVVPVPVLLFVAAVTLIFGTDHPAGKWSQRHLTPATAAAVMAGHDVQLDHDEERRMMQKKADEAEANVQEVNVDEDEVAQKAPRRPSVVEDSTVVRADIDVAVNEALTLHSARKIFLNPVTWLPALAYMTTFGFELAVDSNLASVLLAPHPTLGQLNAGYLASIFGLLNLFTRPLGGYVADKLFARYGTAGKKYLTITLGFIQGATTLGFGLLLYLNKKPDLGHMMGLVVVIAFACEMANGANFSLVPHCNVYSNGTMSGLVGAMGNLGGIFYALIFRFKPGQGVGWIYCGVLAMVVNAVLFVFPTPRH